MFSLEVDMSQNADENLNEEEKELNLKEKNETIFCLPDHFMISVFRCLSLRQLLVCGRVCKKWNRLSRDGSLWVRIDLKKYKKVLNLTKLKQIISIFGTSATRHLLLGGNFSADDSSSSNSNFNRPKLKNQPFNDANLSHLDSSFFTEYLTKFPSNLNTIHFEYLDLSKSNFLSFLPLVHLSSLSLTWCYIGENWFLKPTNSASSQLKNLSLIRTGHLVEEDIANICALAPQLVTLVINQAESSLDDKSIQIICESLIHLQNLDLINTCISDSAILSICELPRLSSNLKRLNLTMSSKISNISLAIISEKLVHLDTLYLTSCFGISNINLLKNLTSLKYLNLNNTSIAKEQIKEHLLPVLPNCEIEYGHEKMLSGKLTWTINGSRNCVCSF